MDTHVSMHTIDILIQRTEPTEQVPPVQHASCATDNRLKKESSQFAVKRGAARAQWRLHTPFAELLSSSLTAGNLVTLRWHWSLSAPMTVHAGLNLAHKHYAQIQWPARYFDHATAATITR